MKDSFIKHMKPKSSYYNSCVINPKQCKKYIDACRNEPIICRSGLEQQFVLYCESNPQILRWASEPIKIPYICRLDGEKHDYYPDYIIENKKGNKVIVEVKPQNQTVKPKAEDSLWLKEQWIKNNDKWNAAKAFADKNNMKFIIVTEKFFT